MIVEGVTFGLQSEASRKYHFLSTSHLPWLRPQLRAPAFWGMCLKYGCHLLSPGPMESLPGSLQVLQASCRPCRLLAGSGSYLLKDQRHFPPLTSRATLLLGLSAHIQGTLDATRADYPHSLPLCCWNSELRGEITSVFRAKHSFNLLRQHLWKQCLLAFQRGKRRKSKSQNYISTFLKFSPDKMLPGLVQIELSATQKWLFWSSQLPRNWLIRGNGITEL